jgi:hypothetical protein
VIDPNKPIADLLSDVCADIEISFPKGQPSFPLTTIAVIDNSSAVVLDGLERFSSITVQLDVWDNQPTRERCEATAQAVSAKMIEAGFTRQTAQSLEEDHLHRLSMTFRGVLDEKTFNIYERS